MHLLSQLLVVVTCTIEIASMQLQSRMRQAAGHAFIMPLSKCSSIRIGFYKQWSPW